MKVKQNSLLLIGLTIVTTSYSVPDSSAMVHRYGDHLPSVSPQKGFLARAASLRSGVGRGASKLVQRAQTLRSGRKSSSPEKVENTGNASPISAEQEQRWSGECYGNLPPGGVQPSDYLTLDKWTQQPAQVGPTHPHQESDYLFLHDLKLLLASYPTDAYSNIPDAVQDEHAEKLRHALNLGDVESARQLIEEGGDPNETSENNGTTLLYAATQKGDEDLARWLLLEKRADATIANHSGRTALHQAALFGRPVIASLLLEAGGDIDAIDETNSTPLDFAQQRNRVELVDIFLAAKAKRGTLE